MYNITQHLAFEVLFMITIKDYAKETGVSYEAVRQRIKRYEKELEGHIHRQGRTQFLDDVAVAFLNEHRLQNPVVMYDRGAGEDFRALEQELAESRAEAKDYWEQLKKKEESMAYLIRRNEQLEIKANSVARLEADNAVAKEKADRAEKAALDAQKELTEAHKAFEKDRQKKELEIKKKDEEIQEKNERIQAWERYATEVSEYERQSSLKKLFGLVQKPTPPVFED